MANVDNFYCLYGVYIQYRGPWNTFQIFFDVIPYKHSAWIGVGKTVKLFHNVFYLLKNSVFFKVFRLINRLFHVAVRESSMKTICTHCTEQLSAIARTCHCVLATSGQHAEQCPIRTFTIVPPARRVPCANV